MIAVEHDCPNQAIASSSTDELRELLMYGRVTRVESVRFHLSSLVPGPTVSYVSCLFVDISRVLSSVLRRFLDSSLSG